MGILATIQWTADWNVLDIWLEKPRKLEKGTLEYVLFQGSLASALTVKYVTVKVSIVMQVPPLQVSPFQGNWCGNNCWD